MPSTNVRTMVSAVPEPRGVGQPIQAVTRWLSSLAGPGEAFSCGVRVRDGVLDGESRIWRFRRSLVEPGRTDGVCVLRHGSRTVLKLRFAGSPAAPLWAMGWVRLRAEDVGSGARLDVLCRADAARRMQTNT